MPRRSTPNHIGTKNANLLVGTNRSSEQRAAGMPPSPPGPVVLLHGRGYAASTWFPLLPGLAREYRVVAVDLPGFGCSPVPGGLLRTARDGLSFFVEPVEEVLSTLAPGPMTRVGHSL